MGFCVTLVTSGGSMADTWIYLGQSDWTLNRTQCDTRLHRWSIPGDRRNISLFLPIEIFFLFCAINVYLNTCEWNFLLCKQLSPIATILCLDSKSYSKSLTCDWNFWRRNKVKKALRMARLARRMRLIFLKKEQSLESLAFCALGAICARNAIEINEEETVKV